MNNADEGIIQHRVEGIIELVLTSQCLGFIDMKTRHYLTGEAFEKIPRIWLDEIDSREADEWLCCDWMYSDICPTTTTALHLGGLENIGQATKILALPRKVQELVAPIFLSQAASAGMTPKKKHEVQYLAPFVNEFCKCDTCVDVGAGNGYLTCVCGLLLGKSMIGVEGLKERCLNEDRLSRRSQIMMQESRVKPQKPRFESATVDSLTCVNQFRSQIRV